MKPSLTVVGAGYVGCAVARRLDPTKIIPEEVVPLRVIGRMALMLMPDQAEKLARDSAAMGFVMDAFAHLKAIGHCKGSAVILERAGIADGEGVGPWEDLPDMAKRRYWDREPKLRNLA